eukprot:3951152-Pyramimonas_sp.AAC.1
MRVFSASTVAAAARRLTPLFAAFSAAPAFAAGASPWPQWWGLSSGWTSSLSLPSPQLGDAGAAAS